MTGKETKSNQPMDLTAGNAAFSEVSLVAPIASGTETSKTRSRISDFTAADILPIARHQRRWGITALALTLVMLQSLIQPLHGEEMKPFKGGWGPSTPHVSEDHPEDMARFVSFLQTPSHLSVFEGLPHHQWEKEMHSSELLREDIIRRQGYPFYFSRLKISDNDCERIQDLFATFSQTAISIEEGTAKRCGGFHPDYLIAWSKDDGQSYSTLICFGCAEMIIAKDGFSLQRDITAKPFVDELKAILSKYRVNRPTKQNAQ
jgi:hypothetical protein